MVETPFAVFVGDLDVADTRSAHIDAPAGWSVDSSVLAGNVTADLQLAAHAGGVMVTGAVAATFTHSCNRCLQGFSAPVTAAVAQDFVADEGADYRVMEDHVDVEPLLRDELLLALPLAPVCREDCRGLCPECGTDLNTGACSGHESGKDSPFAELRSLFDQE